MKPPPSSSSNSSDPTSEISETSDLSSSGESSTDASLPDNTNRNSRFVNAFIREPNPRRFTRAIDLASDLANTLTEPGQGASTRSEHRSQDRDPNQLASETTQSAPSSPAASARRYSDQSSTRQTDPGGSRDTFTQTRQTTPASSVTDEMARLSAIWRSCCTECLNTKGLPTKGLPGEPSQESSSAAGESSLNYPQENSPQENSPQDNSPQENSPRESNREDLGARLVWMDGDEGLVYAQSSVWATRLRMMSPTLVACLRQGGLAEINRLRVRVQPVEQEAPAPKQRPKLNLSEKSGEILSRLADRTADADLAASLQRLARHKRS